MDRSSQQLLVGTFAYLLAIGSLVATLGAAFGTWSSPSGMLPVWQDHSDMRTNE